MSLTLEVYKRNEEETELTINGILDISTVESFHIQIGLLNDVKQLIIDFSQMEFIDSTGIGCIMEVIYLSQEKEFLLTFQGLSEAVKEIFETVGLFQIAESLQVGVK